MTTKQSRAVVGEIEDLSPEVWLNYPTVYVQFTDDSLLPVIDGFTGEVIKVASLEFMTGWPRRLSKLEQGVSNGQVQFVEERAIGSQV